jgi:thiol-disulfide isomerase/thioredoxin
MKYVNRYTVVGAVVALVTVTVGYLFKTHQSQSRTQALAARQLTALTLPDLDGTAQSLSQWQGKILVVNLWASWCAPCREEMPGFSRLQQRFAAKNVQFVGIGIDSREKMREYSREVPVTYPLLVGDATLLGIVAALGNSAGGLPYTMVMDTDGSVRETHLGEWKEADLAATLESLSR